MDKLFLTILNMSLTGAFVIAVICLARLPLKKTPKIISYCLWAVAGFRLVFPFSIESVFSLMPINAAPIPTDIAIQAAPRINSGVAAVDSAVSAILPAPPQPEMMASLNPLQVWTTIGAYVWLLGVAVMFVYGVVSFIILKRKMRGAVHKSANIYEAEYIKSPFVLGVFMPKIYLPTGLSEQEKRYIILHEQTHIRRMDHIIKLAAYFILCLHWFNPLAWVAFLLMNADMEMSCDERVLKEMGSETKKDYSLSLLSLAAEQRFVSGCPLAFGAGDVKIRVKNILNFRKPPSVILALAVVFVVTLSAVFAMDRASGDSPAGVFEDYTDYMLKYSETLDHAVLADGIRLRLISAYKDQESMSLFFTLTDETGDRLNEETGFSADFNYTPSSTSIQLIDYDRESKAAAFFLVNHCATDETIGEDISFSLSDLRTRQPSEISEGISYSYMSDGIWQTAFKIQDSGHQVTIPAKQEIMLGKRKVNAHKITVSPLSVRVFYEGFYPTEGHWYSAFSDYELPGQAFPEEEVFITYKDGTKVILSWCGADRGSTGAGYLATENFSIQVTNLLELIEVEKVKSITIYGQEFLL